MTDDSITGVFPSVIGVGATKSLSFGGVVATPNTRVAIASDSSCAALELVVTVDTLEPILMPNPINTASPSLTVCYSLDAGNNYVAQVGRVTAAVEVLLFSSRDLVVCFVFMFCWLGVSACLRACAHG